MEAFVILSLAVVGYGVHMLLRGRQMTPVERLERAVQWLLGGSGAWLLFAAIGHLFLADEVAESIGWATGSPFQREIGFSDLAWGVLGLCCIRMRGSFREAFVLGTAIFLWGAAGGHIYEMIAEDNFSRNNSGLLLATDILLPVVNAALVWKLRQVEKGAMTPARTPAGVGATGD
jgi:hypothetical protein